MSTEHDLAEHDLTEGDLTSHVRARIAQTPTTPRPFTHLVVDDVLPDDLFERLSADLPPAVSLIPVATKGWVSVARYEHHGTALLTELTGRDDPGAWQALRRILTATEIRDSLQAVFCTDHPTASPEAGLRIDVRLDCAAAGGHLYPHTDAPILFMKALIYLSCARPDASLDTLLYAPKDPRARIDGFGVLGDYTDDTYRHEDPEDHHVVTRIPFRPNRLLAFPRGRDTLHGLAPVAADAAPRYLISIHYKHTRDRADD